MSTSGGAAAGVKLIDRDEGEELQRAELYGVLARLWFAPPDAPLLEQFSVAVTEAPAPGSFLEAPWQALVSALRGTDTNAARAEYEALFTGVGRPDVLLYGSAFISGALNDKPLVALRADLDELGLARSDDVAHSGETEDHIAVLFEVMRYLIAGDEIEICNLERQRRFFRTHVQPWAGALFEAVGQHPKARLYAALAAFSAAFVQVETQGFDMIE
jgi:TorA maturation chaperone TorD